MRSSVDSCCGTSGALDIAKSIFDRTSPSIWRSGLVTLIPRMRAKAWSIWWFYAKSCARQMSYRQCLSGIGKLSVHAKDFKDTSKEEKTTPQPWQEQEPRESCATGKEKDALKWLGYCEPDERPMEFFFAIAWIRDRPIRICLLAWLQNS